MKEGQRIATAVAPKRRRKQNRSKAIRHALLALGIDAPTQAIVEHCGKHRIKVTANLVSQIRSRLKRNRDDSNQLSMQGLILTRIYVNRVGSLVEAKRLLLALEKLAK